MMHLFLNGLAASAGAGLTYLHNVVPQLSATPGTRVTLAVRTDLRNQFERLPGVTLSEADPPSAVSRRFWFEQVDLPALVSKSGADVVLSAGNFAMRKSPVPQIVLSGNSLYTSADFLMDLRFRKEYAMCLDTRARALFARKAVQWADCTVAPTHAFADELQRWTGKHVFAIHHGFDRKIFFGENSGLPLTIQQKLNSEEGSLKLLFVSHYNYYRNFETLLRAIPLIRKRMPGRKIRLFLTCRLQDGANPGAYRTEVASSLIRELGIREEVVELGTVPYPLLHHLYKACDIYVTPAYTETFAHPLVEAMASGLPIVASDLAVHREVAREAADYFPRYSAEALAERVALIAASSELADKLSAAGRLRSTEFSWKTHVEKLLNLASSMCREIHHRTAEGRTLASTSPRIECR